MTDNKIDTSVEAVERHVNADGWVFVDLPVGPQTTPTWAKDLHIEWMDGFGNKPGMRLKTDRDIGVWPDQRFVREKTRFLAQHADGRAVTHYHSGAISLVTVQRRVRTGRAEWHDEPEQILATPQQEGYAGRGFRIVMGGKGPLRGKEVTLRGPWHGGPPPGYTQITYVDMSSKYVQRDICHARKSRRHQKPWWRHMGYFGVEIRNDVLATIFARFQPHLRLALVDGCLEPLKAEWDCPKSEWLAKQRIAAA